MPAITLETVAAADADMRHITALATSEEPEATDRLGNTKPTWAGLVATFQALQTAILAAAQENIDALNAEATVTAVIEARDATFEARDLAQGYAAALANAVPKEWVKQPAALPWVLPPELAVTAIYDIHINGFVSPLQNFTVSPDKHTINALAGVQIPADAASWVLVRYL